ncbi:spore gernimation protein GerPE [Bacillus atrophaeus]|uniref:spore germination protein GerPE n=1 Tax=Bacillus atrophaeus TaxID=1452 RepID=UPI000D024FE9|nr:spore germination protein GerPE [Bacillus atrophaeus]PRS07834.1 spore gernimation protein GerPE [Bacillus atrophaeus]
MLKRLSHLRFAKINSIGISSVFQAGDTNEIDMNVKVFAVQRYIPLYEAKEGSFNRDEYQIFQQPAVKPLPETGIQSAFCHEVPSIRVRSVNIQGVSSSSVFHIGSASAVYGDARVKHIREIPFSNSQTSQS